MKPELFFSWVSEHGLIIDNIKIKKTIKFFPIKFTAQGLYNLQEHRWSHKLSCKDQVLNGKISFDPRARAIEYRKRFALPFVGGKLGGLVASGKWLYNEQNQSWEPTFRVGVEFRQGGAEVVGLNALRFKPRLFYKNIGIEARTQLTLQVPKQLLFEMPAGSVAHPNDDDDAFGCSLDVQELNLCLVL